jgi:hypothetical protein
MKAETQLSREHRSGRRTLTINKGQRFADEQLREPKQAKKFIAVWKNEKFSDGIFICICCNENLDKILLQNSKADNRIKSEKPYEEVLYGNSLLE